MRDSLSVAASVHDEGWRTWTCALVAHVEPAGEVAVAARAVLLAGFVVWSLRFFAHALDPVYLYDSFMHLVHLPFHEAGHILFLPFGSFLMSLDILVGRLANLLGIVLMIVGLAWGASVVARQRAQAARS